MKAVLISINPKWCELIASGKKTVEVRKTKPKLDVPFKCYIYETKGKLRWCNKCQDTDCERPYPNCACWEGQGKVIGEFVCDRIENFLYEALDITYMLRKFKGTVNDEFFEGTQVTYQEAYDYCKGMDWDEDYSDIFYGWHISNLVIYDKPRELSEFYVEGDCDCMNCKNCAWFDRGNGYNVEDDCNLAYKGAELHKSFKPITRPPQSWCYVEGDNNANS